ncbi:MAG: RIP metalloprotease RseP [Candidatus Nomurabacteria bacterium]|nr:RIP metalloprotease RseP [Candidatus Nomurabacteria bacterium]
MSIIIFIVIILVLVVSHEFGHFIVAKLNNIRVDEFSFGFPPKIYGKKIGETTYNLNALPFGGYVKIFGENINEADLLEVGFLDKKETPEKLELAERSLINKPRYIQALVMVAGVVMNFLVAWLLLSVGFMSGLPSSVGMAPRGAIVNNQYLTVTSVVKGSPAEIAGLKTGDKLLALDTTTDSTKLLSSNFGAENVQSFIKKHGGEQVKVEFIRAKENKELEVTPINNKDGVPVIGIAMDTIGTLQLPVHKAVWEGLKLTTDLTISTAVGFYKLISQAVMGKGDMSAVTGPIGIVGVVGDAAKFGFIYLLSFTALISINLAVINLLPFPALDGGRILFLLIEKIKGSRIKPKISNAVNMVGFGLLMLLMVVITYHDIVKLL